jgi:uncharacterized repeat protein (TIGR02543 family)
VHFRLLFIYILVLFHRVSNNTKEGLIMKRARNAKNLLRRGLLLGLALLLAVPSIPGLSLTAKAAAYNSVTTNTTLSNGDTISGTISGCTVTIPAGATVTVTGQITISGTVNFVGGGKLVRGSSFTSASMIKVSSGAVLNIGTSEKTGVTADGNGTTVAVNGGGIYVDGGTLNLYGGATVSNHYISKSDGMGGGIYVNSGILNMYDGALVKYNKSTVTSTNGGGGIAIYHGATFNMYGGTISGNDAPCTASGTGGGGVYNGGTFNMSGGTISGNTAGRNGGAVHIDGGSNSTGTPVMNMTGGLITGNYSKYWAGGIEILGNGGLKISGGKINSNTCESGGGGIEFDGITISGYSNGYLEVSGSAQITGNMRSSLQDNVYIDKNIIVTGNLTGSIGISNSSSSVGGVFGTASGSYTGMENFFCDGNKLVGTLSGTNVIWKAGTTALTGVTLSTNSPVTGTAITSTLSPSGASATYQWYRNATSSNSGGTIIVGATESSYTPTSADVGKYLYVIANGTGGCTGIVTSAATTSAVQWSTTVATPSFSAAAGTYASAQSVLISCATDDATIYYTTNGSTPTSGSTKYNGAITVSSTTTIKAIAVKAECGDSAVASAAYTILNVAATPYTGAYNGTAHNAVTVTGTLAGDTITYSTDGTIFSPACPQCTDAGSYSIYVKVTSTSYADWESGLKTAVISRAAGSVTITGDPSKTYNGSVAEDPAVTKNGTGVVTYSYYTDNSGVIGILLSGAPTAAGTYWVKAEMAQDTNYTSAEDTKKFTISRAAGSITITGDLSKAYDGSAVADPAVNKNGTGAVTYTYYSDNAGTIGTALSGAPSNVGIYWVKAVMAEDANHTGAEATKQFSITAVNISGITTTPYTGTYDGAAHEAATVSGTLAGDTIKYSADGTTFLSTCPKYTDAGSYPVYIKITRTGCVDWESGLITAVISRAAGSITITGDPSKTYDGSAVADPAVNKNGTGAVTYTYYTDNAGTMGTALSGAPSAAGTYWVRAAMAEDTNYTCAEATKQFSIQNQNVSGITVTPYAGTYDGKAHDAVAVAGLQAGDTVTYSTDGAAFTEACPQYTNAGSYPVYVKVARTGCACWESGLITAVISRAAGTIAITGDPSKACDGKAVTDPAVSKNGTGVVTYTYYSNNEGAIGAALSGAPSAAGTYWVRAVMAQDTNYTQAEATRQFSITSVIWYKVVYKSNTAAGGSVPADSRLYAKDSTVTILGNTGALSKKGYTFTGWNTNENGKGVFYKAGDTFSIYCDTTLYAVWKINSYKVRFEDWDGSLIKEETVHYGSAASAPADPRRTGYTFSGWNQEYGFISGDTAVTAQYKINTYTVRFSTDGGSHVPDQTVAYLGSAKQPEEPSKSGYTFAGWFLDSELSTPYNFNVQVDSDIALFAKWTENAEVVQKIAQGLTIESAFKFADGDIWECVTSGFMILNSKTPGVQIVWSSSDESAVRIENGGEKAKGIVNRPKDRDVSVVITAAISKDGAIAKKTFLLVIKRENASKNETRIPTERTASIQAGQNTEGEAVYRTVLSDGTNIDTVILTAEKIKKLIEKSDESGIVSVSIGKYDADPADEFAFEVSTGAVAALAQNNLDLTLKSQEGSVTLSADTLKQATKYGMDLYFRIVPAADEQDEVQNALSHDGTILSLLGAGTKEVLGVPRIIETNMEGYLTTVQLPLRDIDQSKLADPKFLSSLCVYVEHGDGTTELITGKILYDGTVPCAIEFNISNYSRFQIVSVKPAGPWDTTVFCIGGVVILLILLIIMIYFIWKSKSKQKQ